MLGIQSGRAEVKRREKAEPRALSLCADSGENRYRLLGAASSSKKKEACERSAKKEGTDRRAVRGGKGQSSLLRSSGLGFKNGKKSAMRNMILEFTRRNNSSEREALGILLLDAGVYTGGGSVSANGRRG